MSTLRPSHRRALTAQLAGLLVLASEGVLYGLGAGISRFGSFERFSSSDSIPLALVVIAIVAGLPLASRVLLVIAYSTWLHRAYGNALELASEGEARITPTAREAVIGSLAPLVSLVRGVIVLRDLDGLSRARPSDRRAWWLDAPWWRGLNVSLWTDAAAWYGYYWALPRTTWGVVLLVGLVTRWLSIPGMIAFIRRIERLQRERAAARDWASAF